MQATWWTSYWSIEATPYALKENKCLAKGNFMINQHSHEHNNPSQETKKLVPTDEEKKTTKQTVEWAKWNASCFFLFAVPRFPFEVCKASFERLTLNFVVFTKFGFPPDPWKVVLLSKLNSTTIYTQTVNESPPRLLVETWKHEVVLLCSL